MFKKMSMFKNLVIGGSSKLALGLGLLALGSAAEAQDFSAHRCGPQEVKYGLVASLEIKTVCVGTIEVAGIPKGAVELVFEDDSTQVYTIEGVSTFWIFRPDGTYDRVFSLVEIVTGKQIGVVARTSRAMEWLSVTGILDERLFRVLQFAPAP